MPLAWCALAALLFGASTPVAKHLLDGMSPFLLAGMLYLGAAIGVLPVALRAKVELDRGSAVRVGGAVLCGGIVGPVLLMLALREAPAGSVALWLNLETVATAILALWIFDEHLHAPTWMAVALILVASAILSGFERSGIVPAVLVALACVAWGIDNNLTSVIDRLTPAQIVLAKGIAGGAINVAIGFGTSDGVTARSIAIALLAGAVSYGLSLVLYIRGAQQLGAARSQLVFSTSPAWGLAIAWLALGEPMTWRLGVAALLMAIATLVWSRERHAHAHAHDAVEHTHWHRHDDGHHDHSHDGLDPSRWHSHAHAHSAITHTHEHHPDIHHRHAHDHDR
jgi:drug/metabolite transporter (DMT)-like permease